MRALALLLLLPASANATKYTLEQLLARVRSDYPGVSAARANIDVADAQLSQARRLWWPQGQITFGFTLAPSIHCVDPSGVADVVNCTNTDKNSSSITNFSLSDFTNPALKLDLTLVQPLYTFGKIEAAIKAAHAGEDAAKAQLAAAEADAIYNAVRAYWGVKAARAASATISDGRDRVKDWVGSVDAALEKGTGKYTEQDLLRLKIAVDTLELGLLDLKKAEVIAVAALRTLAVDPTAD